MTRVIVQQAFGAYGAAMASAVIRLLTLLAFVMMPLAMSSTAFAAPQGAATVAMHHDAMAEHCGGGGEEEDNAPATGKMDCAAACTAIAPAGSPLTRAELRPRASREISLATPYGHIVPEIATPPPRQG